MNLHMWVNWGRLWIGQMTLCVRVCLWYVFALSHSHSCMQSLFAHVVASGLCKCAALMSPCLIPSHSVCECLCVHV